MLKITINQAHQAKETATVTIRPHQVITLNISSSLGVAMKVHPWILGSSIVIYLLLLGAHANILPIKIFPSIGGNQYSQEYKFATLQKLYSTLRLLTSSVSS